MAAYVYMHHRLADAVSIDTHYLAALRAADARDFAPLLAFVRGTG